MSDVFVQASPTWPVGTVLRAYDKRFFAGAPPERGTAPSGPEVASAVVNSLGGASFEGLEDDQTYYIGAQVAGQYRWTTLRMNAPVAAGTAHGVPGGGNAGDVMTKTSSVPYAYAWIAPVSAGITLGEADLRYYRLAEVVKAVNVTGDVVLPAVTVATIHRLTLKVAAPKVTLPSTAEGTSITVYVIQDGSGSRVPTFVAPSGSIRWPEGTLPSFTPAANAVDVLTFVCADGAHWDGFVSGYAVK